MSRDWEIQEVFVFDVGWTIVLVNMPLARKQPLPVKASTVSGEVELASILIGSEAMPRPRRPDLRAFETRDHVDAEACRATRCWLRIAD